MHLPSFRQWLAAVAVCTVLIVLCVPFVDLPLAQFADVHVGQSKGLAVALDSAVLLVPFSVAVLFVGGSMALIGRALPRWAEAPIAGSISLMWAIVANFFLLQPLFGRMDFKGWKVAHLYGFYWFQGHGGAGFPSGHMTLVTAFLGVLWFTYPRARIVFAALVAAEGLGVVLLNWHFLSDALAGVVLGASAAILTTALMEKHVTRSRADGQSK